MDSENSSLSKPAKALEGLEDLWSESLGDPVVSIAILDGPVDSSHPSLRTADLTQLDAVGAQGAPAGDALQHGTHVASVVFGQHDSPIQGVAPNCRGLLVQIFGSQKDGSIAPCSQVDLARAINTALSAGATIVNISGGQFSESGSAHPLLADAVRKCHDRGALIVAAAGNEGCDCVHVPGVLDSVLVVGAMDFSGKPLESSNWGGAYQERGILAPGKDIVGALPSGGTAARTGTSYATPIVSGVVGLLVSLQLKSKQPLDVAAVRAAILESSRGCDFEEVPDCRRLLVGRLDIPGAMSLVKRGSKAMSLENDSSEATRATIPVVEPAVDPTEVQGLVDPVQSATERDTTSESATIEGAANVKPAREQSEVSRDTVLPAACSCQAGAPPQLVYALGLLGYDFGAEARRDSILQHMADAQNPNPNPYDARQLLNFLDRSPADAAAIIWTLRLDATPIYAIKASGPFAAETYGRLCQFLGEQTTEGVERVSIPGTISGSVRLLTGEVVPFIEPILRGMYSWTTLALVEAVCGKPPAENASEKEKEAYQEEAFAVENFLRRVYDELRNLGTTPQDRSINYAATNALLVAEVFHASLKDEMNLDTIEVERSPICRQYSECWDVKLTFFDPTKVLQRASKVYRFTVDVSDVVPVMVGEVRSWFIR